MRIYHNIPALNAWRNMGVNQSQLSKSLERLSSGLRINRAADDAAGLTISEKMRGQISGLTMAAKNAQDGISLIQTAEGALNETHSILQRMRELAVEAANDTLTAGDRQEIQKEIDQLIDEIDRIGNTTEFNTKKLLNGSLAQTLSDNSDYFDAVEATSDTKDGVYDVSFTQVARRAVLEDSHGFQGITGSSLTVKINGETITFATGDSLDTVISKINVATDKTNVEAIRGAQGGLVLRSTDFGSKYSVTIQGDANLLYNLGLAGTEDKTVTTLSDAGLDTVGSINRSAAQGDGLYMTQTAEGDNAQGLKVKMNVTEIAASITVSTPTAGAGAARKYYLNGVEVGASTISAGSLANNIASAANALGIEFSTDGGDFIFTSKDTGLEAEVSFVVASGHNIVSVNTDKGDIQGVTHNFTGASVSASIASDAGTAVLVINGATAYAQAGSAASEAAQLASIINADASKYGVVASANGTVLALKSLDAGEGAQIKISSQETTKFTPGLYIGTESTSGPEGQVTVDNDNTLKFHIGANKDQTMQMGVNDMRSDALGNNVTGNRFESVKDLKYDGVTTREAAEDAIELIDEAIQNVSSERAKLGAYQNRLEHTIANLNVSAENMTASESRIRDVDMAREMMKFTKYQILNQSSTAMLAQANTLPQGVLTLLR